MPPKEEYDPGNHSYWPSKSVPQVIKVYVGDMIIDKNNKTCYLVLEVYENVFVQGGISYKLLEEDGRVSGHLGPISGQFYEVIYSSHASNIKK